jgi:hypothetical protein
MWRPRQTRHCQPWMVAAWLLHPRPGLTVRTGLPSGLFTLPGCSIPQPSWVAAGLHPRTGHTVRTGGTAGLFTHQVAASHTWPNSPLGAGQLGCSRTPRQQHALVVSVSAFSGPQVPRTNSQRGLLLHSTGWLPPMLLPGPVACIALSLSKL